MSPSILFKSLRDYRRSLTWWALGLGSLSLFMCAYFPTVRESAVDLSQYIDKMPEAMKVIFMSTGASISSPSGYLNMELFSFMAPLLFMVFAIGFGARAVAGEEEGGTLDVLLANPIRRTRLLVEKFGAMLAGLVVLTAIFYVSTVAGAKIFDMNVSFVKLAEATAGLGLLALVLGTLSLALGAATGKRGMSVGTASGVGVAAYLLNTFSPLVKALKPYRFLSPFYWYFGNDPITNGLKGAHVAAFVGVTAVFLIAAAFAFERRDV